MPGPILVAYDDSPAARAALAFAVERAAALDRPVRLVGVVPEPLAKASFTQFLLPGLAPHTPVPIDDFVRSATKNLEAVAEETRAKGVKVEVDVRVGDTADEIIGAADACDAEQIVVGYMSYEKRLPYGMGSVADKVARYGSRTVTIVRPPGSTLRGPS